MREFDRHKILVIFSNLVAFLIMTIWQPEAKNEIYIFVKGYKLIYY